MPELTASVKVGLGIIAASAALITGLLGNVLATHVNAVFSGTPPKTGKRPAILWVAFFISAALSVVAGSLATFAPVAPAKAAQPQPKIVVTSLSSHLVQLDLKSLYMMCRETIQLANTSDITTSVVTVGTQVNLDGTVIHLAPTAYQTGQNTAQVRVAVKIWRVAPAIKDYANIKSVDQFLSITGVTLPVKVEARGTAAVIIDFAMQFAKLMPQRVMTMQVLRFPDIADLKTNWIPCR